MARVCFVLHIIYSIFHQPHSRKLGDFSLQLICPEDYSSHSSERCFEQNLFCLNFFIYFLLVGIFKYNSDHKKYFLTLKVKKDLAWFIYGSASHRAEEDHVYPDSINA